MPGLCGVVSLSSGADRSLMADSVSRMLAPLQRETFYTTDSWNCASGRAFFSSIGLASRQKSLPPNSPAIEGLSYGRLYFAGARPADWLPDISGFFSLAARDRVTGDYWVVADRRASEPLYYTKWREMLCFAPEVKSLLALPGLSRKVDYAALSSLLVSGHLCGEQTLFEGVRHLKGGHALHIRDGKVEQVEYWRFAPGSRAAGESPEDLVEQLSAILDRAVNRDLGSSDDRPAIFLSGGYDSRAILGYARGRADVHTVSWGLRENGQESDAAVAAKLAEHCGAKHMFLERQTSRFGDWFEEMNYLTDAQSDVAAFHPQELELMRRIRELGFQRVIRGDETFGWHRRSFALTAALASVGLRQFGLVEGLDKFFVAAAADRMSRESRAVAQTLLEGWVGSSANQCKDYLYYTQRLQNYLNSCCRHKQVLLEHCNPLLDDEVLEFLSFVPDQLRTDKKLLRMLLAEKFPDLDRIAYARVSGLENWSALWREDTPVRDYIEAQLADRESVIWTIFDRPALLRLFESRSDKMDYGWSGLAKRTMTRVTRDALKPFSRSAADSLQGSLALHAPLGATKLLLRFLVVKNWSDRFEPEF